jgi:hypothetical protein
MSSPLGNDFVSLREEFEKQNRGKYYPEPTWFGRLAMPIPSEEGADMVSEWIIRRVSLKTGQTNKMVDDKRVC